MTTKTPRMAAVFAIILLSSLAAVAQEPPLPEGLGDEPALPEGLGNDEPALPEGLGNGGNGEPALPEGLGEEPPPTPTEEEPQPFTLPFDLNGFIEGRIGSRIQNDPHEKQMSLNEARLQLEIEKALQSVTLNLRGDFVYDHIVHDHDAKLETGEGWFDLREANLTFRPLDFVDAKVGRQILTWGTGDLVFINDLFPKDWRSFLLGRDVEYLKAPSDALKLSFFTEAANLDVVYTPRFDADRYIDGERLSYYNAGLMRRAGRNAMVRTELPDEWLTDDEIALRLYRNFRGYQFALYGYRGFWKSPAGMNPANGKAIFPELAVYGASVRGPVGKGIGNAEFGWYDSLDDRDGDNPFVRNSELRFLAGYERELARNFTAGLQYYLEHMLHRDNARKGLPPGAKIADENRHVLTLRLTRLLMNQNLKLSLFTFYSPSDNDAYLRPNVNYKISDRWTAEIGGNVFIGEDDHTFFGQFERNSNVYAALRFSF